MNITQEDKGARIRDSLLFEEVFHFFGVIAILLLGDDSL